MKGARILVVEDNERLRRGIARALAEAGAKVEQAEAGDEAIDRLRGAGVPFDAVVTDLRLPGAPGLEVLDAARQQSTRTAVLLMTAYGSIDNAVEAMRRGAFDFVQKPFELEQLELRVTRALEHGRLVREVHHLRAERAERLGSNKLIGTSQALRAAVELAQRVAASPSTVLVTGETGTGKELIAGLIHERSPRASAPFVKVNCAALPETLLESELFGHERGAFTGADRRRVGRFEQADGGTLFLDEIGDLATTTQAKLLRVLQEREFHRLGATHAIEVDVRIIAATNQRLEREIEAKRFREDLYFRLNVIRIPLPALRERPEDIELLAVHFLDEFSHEMGRSVRGFGDDALRRMRGYSWPGNVRELRNVVERAVLLSEGERIEEVDLEGARSGGEEHPQRVPPPPARDGVLAVGEDWQAQCLTLKEAEKRLVRAALQESDWVQKDAAALLGISRRKLNYMIQRIGITHPSWRRNRQRTGEQADSAD